MAYTYVIDREAGLVRITVTGRDTAADNERRIREIANDLAWSPGMDVLLDFTGATEVDVAPAEMEAIAMMQAGIDALIGDGSLAIVAGRDLIYGLSRMYETIAEAKVSIKIRVFRDLREGEEWLGTSRDRRVAR